MPFQHDSKKASSQCIKNYPIKLLAYIYRTVQYKSHKTLFHFGLLNYVSLMFLRVYYLLYKPVITLKTESGIRIEKLVLMSNGQ